MMDEFAQSRRRFVLGTGAWLGTSVIGLAAESARTRTISIFHTTDLHGHILPTRSYGGMEDVGGFARCVSCIRNWRRESPDSLLVDIGDVYQGTAESLLNGGNLMIRLFNRLDYDAWVLGNHDFDWGPDALEKNLALSKPFVLTGNLEKGGRKAGQWDGAWKSVKPWVMKEVAGFRVALVGLTTPGLPYWLAPETLGGVAVTSPLDSLRQSIAEAKDARADVVVVLAHMGWRKEDDFANPVRELLNGVEGVDVFLGGHTHQNQPSWEQNSVLCSQAAYHGIQCGRVDLTLDLESRKVVSKQAFSMLMDKRLDLDPVVMEMAEPELEKSRELHSRIIGKVTRRIDGKGRGNRLAELFCEFFSEALARHGSPVDGIFHGTFGTGDLEPGDLTISNCWTLLPYENRLAVAEVTVEELIAIVREDRSERASDRLLWPFRVKLDRAGEPVLFLFKDQPVEPGRRFSIGFNSYDAQSAGRRLIKTREILLAPSAKLKTTEVDTRSALIDGILKRGDLF